MSMNRRQFIQSLVALGFVSTAPRLWASVPRRKIGVALVGLGYYSRNLLAPALQLTQYCHLAGIVTGTPSKIPLWQGKYGIPDANVYDYDNMRQMANNPAIDVVYVVTPTGLHRKFTLMGANAGKHVWCEKPMAMNVGECEEMIAACRKNKVQLSIGYRMQHEPNTQRIMKMAREKPYGGIRLISTEASYRFNGTDHGWRADPRLGGGAMYDMGVYPLNAARYTTGEEPISVNAVQESRRVLYKDVDETMRFTLEFPSGAIAQCATSYARSANFLHVQCNRGWYELRPFQAYNGVRGRTSDGVALNLPSANQQATQMDHDALAIINETAPLVPGEEGLADIRVVEAIFRSAREGRIIKLQRMAGGLITRLDRISCQGAMQAEYFTA